MPLTARDQLKHWIDCTRLNNFQKRVLRCIFSHLSDAGALALVALIDDLTETEAVAEVHHRLADGEPLHQIEADLDARDNQ